MYLTLRLCRVDDACVNAVRAAVCDTRFFVIAVGTPLRITVTTVTSTEADHARSGSSSSAKTIFSARFALRLSLVALSSEMRIAIFHSRWHKDLQTYYEHSTTRLDDLL